MKNGQFYSASALRQLAIQKHGSFEGPVGVADVKLEERARRVALAATATLLHGGSHYEINFSKEAEFDSGWFAQEFVRRVLFIGPRWD